MPSATNLDGSGLAHHIRSVKEHFRATLGRLLQPRADHLLVTIYTRAECSCCEAAKAVIEPRRRRHGFAVEEVDIDADPALVEAYGTSVPVVAVDGKVRFRGKVDPILLDRLLRAEAGRKSHQQPKR